MNPYRLELTLARIFAWTMWTVDVVFAFAWVIAILPDQVHQHRWVTAALLVVVTLIAREHEEDVEEKAVAFEEKRTTPVVE